MSSTAICPSCGEEIRLRSQAKIGQQLNCPFCDAELEVIELDPIELDWAFYEEDWDEEWDEDDRDVYH